MYAPPLFCNSFFANSFTLGSHGQLIIKLSIMPLPYTILVHVRKDFDNFIYDNGILL